MAQCQDTPSRMAAQASGVDMTDWMTSLEKKLANLAVSFGDVDIPVDELTPPRLRALIKVVRASQGLNRRLAELGGGAHGVLGNEVFALRAALGEMADV